MAEARRTGVGEAGNPTGVRALAAALPDYEISRELGRGAMGVVYSGTHRALGRPVAIKQLPTSFSADEAVRDRFVSEARVVASLDHPHVVVIHDFVDRSGHLALVMEHLPNGTVWDQFVHHGLSAPRACGLALATLAGLDHAHDRGVLHRDIKPENLIFTHDWQLKVTDFGIAQVLSGAETMTSLDGAIVGTPAYMAPEQAEGSPCGPGADIYATGSMLYEMLSGALPFPDATDPMAMVVARLTTDPRPLGDIAATVPDAIVGVVMRALARRPEDRYRSATDFGQALGQAAADSWGPEWMSASGLVVAGNAEIERAARTTTAGRAAAGGRPRDEAEEAARDQAGAVAGDQAGAVAGDQAAEAAGAEARAALETVVSATPVVPRSTTRPAGADLNRLAPSDIVSVKEVRKVRSPRPALLLALALLVATGWLIYSGVGSDPVAVGADAVTIAGRPVSAADEPIEVDLTEPVAVAGLAPGPVKATMFDLPIGQGDVAGGTFDPGYLRWTAAGVVELTSGDSGEVSLPVRTANSVYPTAPFVVATVVALGGLASVQANLRGLRRGRIRVGSMIGLAISGAISAAALAVLAMLVLKTPMAVASLAAAAAVGALGCVVLGEAYRRFAKARRYKKLAALRTRH